MQKKLFSADRRAWNWILVETGHLGDSGGNRARPGTIQTRKRRETYIMGGVVTFS